MMMKMLSKLGLLMFLFGLSLSHSSPDNVSLLAVLCVLLGGPLFMFLDSEEDTDD